MSLVAEITRKGERGGSGSFLPGIENEVPLAIGNRVQLLAYSHGQNVHRSPGDSGSGVFFAVDVDFVVLPVGSRGRAGVCPHYPSELIVKIRCIVPQGSLVHPALVGMWLEVLQQRREELSYRKRHARRRIVLRTDGHYHRGLGVIE